MTSRSSGSQQLESNSSARYEPTLVYMMAAWMRARGVNLDDVPGPWQVRQRPLRRPGRQSMQVIPIVTNEHAVVAVDSMERAAEVAGLLNLCGVHELNPIPNLVPPVDDGVPEHRVAH
jgi:hypothetical protein